MFDGLPFISRRLPIVWQVDVTIMNRHNSEKYTKIKKSHFMNSVFVQPGVYSCAIDCILKVSTYLFLPVLSKSVLSNLFLPVLSKLNRGDVHPQPGPNSKQKHSKILGPGKIQRKITQLHPWSANMQIRASRLLTWIFALWSLANTVFFYNIPSKSMTLIYLLYQRLGSTRRLIIKPCRFLDLYSSAKIGENINLVAALPCTSETHSKPQF